MIHILDGQKDEILDYVTLDNIISDDHEKSLEDTLEIYNFIAFADKRYSEFLEKRNRLIIPDEDKTLREFVIFEAAKYKDTEGHKVQTFAHASYLELKKASILYPDSGYTGSASQHGGRVLDDTGWQMGIVEGKGTKTLTINNHTNPYEMLKRIAREFDLELRFRVTHNGNKITGRFVDMLERVGQWRGREVEFGKDLDGIRRVEKQDIVTALLGLGPEDEDGNRLEVLVTDDEALKRWGRIDEHGELQHLIEPYEIQSERSEMTETEARQYTRTALNKRINTQITYETTIVDLEEVPGMENKKIRFGDTIKIKDTKFNPPLYLEARVFEMSRSIKSKAKKDIKLGDFIEHTEEEVNAIWKQLQKEIRNRVSFYEMAEYTYDKLTIDDKDETVFEDGKTFAEAVGIDAKEYADEQDAQIKIDVEKYADDIAEEKAESALDQAKMYAVAKTVYENQMDKIAADMADKADLEYIDGKLVDKVNKGDVYEIEDIDNMINNTVSITKYETDMQGVVQDLESHGTRIGQNADAIGLKADSTDLDAVENSLETKIGNVEVKADAVEISVGEVRADLDGLEYSNKNLLRFDWEITSGTVTVIDPEPDKPNSPIVKIERTSPNGGNSPLYNPSRIYLEPEKGDKLTFSFDFYVESAEYAPNNTIMTFRRFDHQTDGSYVDSVISYNSADMGVAGEYGKWVRAKATYTFVTDKAVAGWYGFAVYASSAVGATNKYMYREIQIEKGKKATPYTPAPEDTDDAISDVSGRVETLDGEIKAVAGEVSLKASQSVVDSLEGRVSTAEGELSVLPGQINAKVSKDGVVGAINATPETLLIDFNKVKITNELEAKHIKSLAGLNVNNQFVVDNSGNVTLKGKLEGATGVFSGELETSKLRVRAPNVRDFDNFGIEIETAQWQESSTNPYRRTGFINMRTGNDALEIDRLDLNGNHKPLAGFSVSADYNMFNGKMVVAPEQNSSNYGDVLRLEGNAADHVYMEFYRSGAGRNGYIGIAGRTHDYITLYADRTETPGGLYLSAVKTNFRGRVQNQDTYDTTSTRAANMYVASNGYYARSSSSRKYKILEEPVKVDYYKLLDVIPKDWYDKNEVEAYAAELSKEFNGEDFDFDELDTTHIKRVAGLVAEDVEDAGLGQYVVYGSYGEVEGLQYDRLWTLLIPIVKDLKNELEELKNERSKV